jgi:GTP-dependent phosphoenolpyruvate carboxykinase
MIHREDTMKRFLTHDQGRVAHSLEAKANLSNHTDQTSGLPIYDILVYQRDGQLVDNVARAVGAEAALAKAAAVNAVLTGIVSWSFLADSSGRFVV